MMWILCSKPSSFCGNEPSLYPRDIVGILIKLIFFEGSVLDNNHNDVIFTLEHLHEGHDVDNKAIYLNLDIFVAGLDKHLVVLAMPRFHSE